MKKFFSYSLILAIILSMNISLLSVGKIGVAAASGTADANDIVFTYGGDVLLTPGKDNTSIYLTWSSVGESPDRVEWVETSRLINGSMPSDCYKVNSQKEANFLRGYTARAEITGLKPDTEYTYRMVRFDGTVSSLYSFKTRADDNAFSFLLAGDPQIGASGTDNDFTGWTDTLDNAIAWFGEDIEFLMTAGDQVNSEDIARQHNGFIVHDWLRSHTLITTVGNHDDGPGYSQYVTYTDNDQNTISEAGRYGGDFWVEYDGVLIMSLNVNEMSVAKHRDFMEKAIAEYTEAYGEPLWTIVTFHFSIYTGGARAGEFSSWRNSLGVYMSELGVDAVLSGHDHVYTRAYMINGTEIIDDKDLYVPVNGDNYGSYHDPKDGDVFYLTANSSSGSKFYDLLDSQPPYAAVSNQENVPNITKVDVTSDSLVFTTYRTSATNEMGEVMDFFAIHRNTEEDKYAPTLNVPEVTYYSVQDGVDLYKGISAYDNVDGVLTEKIRVDGALDVSKTVTLTYQVTDAAGNVTTKQRTFIPLDTQKVITDEETVWKYLDNGTDPYGDYDDRQSWRTLEFDDSGWKEGRSAFGAKGGEPGEHDGIIPSTHISLYYPEGSDDEGANIPCYFFRTTFDVKDPERISQLKGKLLYNDACVVYINGVKVADFNTAVYAEGEITYTGNHAPGEAEAALGSINISDKAALDAINLKEKDNIIAVMLYQFDSEPDKSIFFHFEYLNANADGLDFPFTDVKNNHWYYDAVTKAYMKGLFVGTSEDKFSPNGTMTRAMTWAVLSRIAGENIGASEGKWYLGYQKWAMENGVSDGQRPNDNVTREQLVSMLHRMKNSPSAECDLSSFADENKVSDWAKESVMWAVDTGLMVGKGELLAPRDNATRAEGSVLLLKYLEIEG
ncbi:MAG: S-layer homology domain-containing protein [Clostridia bacterium]|nr:S-layer homology domain-containing protein [Clostridia bacterium]